MQVIFDTGSSWLWVQTPLCQTCPGKAFYDLYEQQTGYADPNLNAELHQI